MADAVGCSRRTIQAIEIGQLKLSDSMGAQIAKRCGIRPEFLFGNDMNGAMLPAGSRHGCDYSESDFESAQIASSTDRSSEYDSSCRPGWYADQLRGVLVDAEEEGLLDLFGYKALKAIQQLERELDRAIAAKEAKRPVTKKARAPKKPRPASASRARDSAA